MFILLLLFNLVVSERIFFIDKKEVIYVDKKLQWNEAAFYCKSNYNGDLLSLEDSKFGASLIPKLKNVAKNVWIGGRFVNNEWRWKNSGNTFSGQKNPLKKNTKLHQCLSINLVEEFPLNFTSFACATPKEFLCERSKIEGVNIMQGFSINNRNYTIFEGHSTWYEAVDICNKHNSRLLTLNPKLTKELSYVLSSYAYLDITFVWVGSFKDHNKWIWISTGNLLPYQEKTQTENCLGFDIKKQKYQPFHCTKTLSFVCENLIGGDFHVTFAHQNSEFQLYQKRVTWEIAHKICFSKDAILANINDVGAANKVALHMEKLALSMVWIGAKTENKSGVYGYTWYDTKTILATRKGASGYPPWLRNYAQPTSEICVGLVDKHQIGRFVIDFCEQAHGFLCQKPVDKPTKGSLKLRTKDRDLHLYQNPQNWYGADETCKIYGCQLFFANNPSDAYVLNHHTSSNKIWLNGIRENNQWKVGNIPNFGGLPKVTPAITTCLAATFINNKTNFYAQSCTKRLPFVCECSSLGDQKVQFQQHEYSVIGKRLTWYEAYGVCKARGQDLAFTYDINEAKFLAQLSLDHGDLWLSGKKDGKTWMWTSINEHLPNRMNKKNLYPPWYTKQTKLPFACLSVGFINYEETFKASACNEQKSFICEKPSPTKTNYKYLQPRVSIVNDKQYTFYPQTITWKNASKECENNYGFLAVIPNLKTAQKIASLTYGGHAEVWVGGKRKNTKWIWSVSGENVQIFENGQIQWENENTLDFFQNRDKRYLSLNRMNPDIPIFVEKTDDDKLGYVCEKAYNPEGDGYLVETVQIDRAKLVFYEERRNYTDAHEFCISKNMDLVTANTKNILKTLEMSAKKFHGVWLGATLRLPNTKFMWNTIRREVTEEIFSLDGFVTNPKWRKTRQLKEYTYNDDEDDDFVQYDSNEYDDEEDEPQKVYYYDSEVYDIKKSKQKRDTDNKKGQIKVDIKYGNVTYRNKRHIKVSVLNNANDIEKNNKRTISGTAGTSKTKFVTFWKLKIKNAKKGVEFKEKLIKCLKMDEMGRLIGLSCSSKQSFVCEKRH